MAGTAEAAAGPLRGKAAERRLFETGGMESLPTFFRGSSWYGFLVA
jgi:hypothetical protein